MERNMEDGMSRIVALSMDGLGIGSEDVAGLAAWLDTEDTLRGCTRRVLGTMPEGALGADLAQLAVSLGSGGAATAMASVVVAWLRRRVGAVSVRVSRPDGSALELRADRVRALDAAGLRAQVDQLAALAWPGCAGQNTAGDGHGPT
jgi:Effector Associated Constant Component 1